MTASTHNPLLSDWKAAGEFPPFAAIRPEHFAPAIVRLAKERIDRVDAIAANPEPPTFTNTVAAYEATGGHIERIDALFEILRLTLGTREVWEVAGEVGALLANHHAALLSHQPFFIRLDAVFHTRHTLELEADELRLLELIHADYVRNGVHLAPDASMRLHAIKERLAQCYVAFNKNLVASTDAFKLILTDEAELAGLPDFIRRAALTEDQPDRANEYVFTLAYSSVVPFLTWSARRDLRERIWRAWTSRCTEPDVDNRPIVREVVQLRAEQAKLLGFENFAQYALTDRMAGTPQAVRELLESIWTPARMLCEAELAALRSFASETGEPAEIEPWDWRYLTERLRTREFNIDAEQVGQYFELESSIRAAFDCAHRLFGLQFRERHDVALYHPDVRLWDVEQHGRLIGYFAADYYARVGKASGAWESEFRMRCDGIDATLPFVINSTSFQGVRGKPTQLALRDVQTLFHEMGHALHSLLSRVRFRRLSGTRVQRDFVEFPSHLMENWVLDPTLLATHARHVETGEAMPDALVRSLRAASCFNEGYELVRYIASALADIELHSLAECADLDIETFQSRYFERLGVMREVDVNHRLPCFRHAFGGSEYAAGYYSYLWAQVLEADAFEAFEESGNAFDAPLAARLHDCLFGIGNSMDPAAAYQAFRRRSPDPLALARKRGFGAVGGSVPDPA
ncbi:M3 family metallopeptidase [Paraburkholderia tropica]|uniref:M3 family metallopeptidase n=1 Tax=Paraburkholderia tropica TaxID=92647 RepID=UPI002ABDD393|nr:M3 family metallopeptidase [Paraburkholderia tropica]